MNTVGNYFLGNENSSVALKENMIIGKKFRFTFLTERLVRLEYNVNGIFEDRPTARVIYRRFPHVKFNAVHTDTLLQVILPYFTLNYDKDKSFSAGKLSPGNNLNILLSGTDKMWYYGHPEARNFGSINYSLDDFSGNLKFSKGLYSTDGFAVLDDSDSYIIDSNGNFRQRDNNEIDLYVFMYRKDFGLCLQDYYKLTGYPFLLPRYALGNWWSKNCCYSNNDIEQLIIKFEEEKIPISTIMLGDKWHLENDPITFNDEVIQISELRQFLNQHKLHLGLSIEPQLSLKEGVPSYQTLSGMVNGLSGDYSFLPLEQVKLNNYATVAFRNWISSGIDIFNIDYNQVKDKKALSMLTHYSYAMYGMLLNKRGVVLSRNHGLAMHRNSVVFNGKTKVDWNTLSVLPRYQAAASNNGISYMASPIGGYYGGIENFELYIRYIQLGVFSPLLVLASDGGKYYKREPWRWNVSELSIIKKYLILRNKLIPYIYTENYIYYKSGSPLIQPLYYKYPKIYDEVYYKNQYFFGSQMLVCPITKKKNTVMNRVVQRMFIPEGTWYELESGKKYPGNKYYMSFYKDEDYPVFCREGSIIVMSLDETTEVANNLEIVVFPGSNGSYQLYEDDGISFNYKNGSFSIVELQFKYELNHYELLIQSASNPGLIPANRNYKIRFKNTKMADVVIQSGSTVIEGKTYLERNDLIIEIGNVSTSSNLQINCNSEGVIENSMTRLINDDIKGILEDLEIETTLKEKIDDILFGDMSVRKKRIAIRKLKKAKLEPKFIKMFLNLLEYIQTV